MKAKIGSVVKVEYEGKFESGEVFDSSSHGDHSHPLEFEVGAGHVVPGFEKAVEGMNIDEEKEIKILPSEGYGEYREDMKREFPRNTLPAEPEPEVGMTLMVGTPQGQQFPATISKVESDKVTIDFNHPLAGKTLNFKIKLISIEDSKKD